MFTTQRRILSLFATVLRIIPTLLLLAVLGACGAHASATAGSNPTANAAHAGPVQLRIGYQRGTNVWTLLKSQGTLEKQFGTSVKVSWVLFTSGPPLIEALNAGSIDVGSTGDTPPVFAQAAGAPIEYVAYNDASGAREAILVAKNSNLKSIGDLKGKKVAFVRASAAQLVVVRALQQAGLRYGDIQPQDLQPADARAAFQNGSVDAWAIWDPFMTAATQELQARILLDGSTLPQTKSYTLASQSFVSRHPDLITTLNQQVQNSTVWARAHLDDYAVELSKETMVDAAVYKQSLSINGLPDQKPIDQQAVAYQQSVADLFYQLGLIPRQLDVGKIAWISTK